MRRPLFWLLLPVALVAVLILGTVFLLVLAVMPPVITVATFAVLAVVALWFFFARRASGSGINNSEGSLMGRQTAKEGLL